VESTKDIGRDVHQDTISVAVRNAAGKGVRESILETKAATMVQFIRGLRGTVQATFEEGTWVRFRAEFTYQQLDGLQALRQGVRRDLLAESRKHRATKLRRQIPGLGPIRAGL